MEKMIIGKIPGYNDNILPTNNGTNGTNGTSTDVNKKDFYMNRLRNNLNEIDFTPSGYILNVDGALAKMDLAAINEAVSKAAGGLAVNVKALGEGRISDALVQTTKDIGQLSKTLLSGISVSKYSNLKSWQKILMEARSGNPDVATKTAVPPYLLAGFTVLGTNDSTVNEVISNEFGPNFFQGVIEDLAGKFKETMLGTGAFMATSAFKSIDAGAGLEMLGKSNEYGLLSLLSGAVQGVKIQLPQTWKSSDYNSSLNLMIKLVSPSGDSESIRRYIKTPLEVLLRASAPITFDGIMSGYPMIWQVKAHGLMTFDLAAITAITITRGGNDTVFNKYDEPLNVDVRIMITPIAPGFAQGPKSDYTMTDPSDVISSMSSLIKERRTLNDVNDVDDIMESDIGSNIYDTGQATKINNQKIYI